MTYKLAHIVNPFNANPSSDTAVAQPITFQTMKIAQSFAREHGVEVSLYSAQFLEDRAVVPDGLIQTPDLTRSILDFSDFKIKRKLPLLKDILDRLYEATNADYCIYTNVDIAVLPIFYVLVNQLINQGYDAFTINRRTISSTYTSVEEIPLMFAQVGEAHVGTDCLVFRRDSYTNYRLGSTFIGMPPVGKILMINLICNAENFREFRDLHATFHLGKDGEWLQSYDQLKNYKFKDYLVHNMNQLNAVVSHYKALDKIQNNEFILELLKRLENLQPENIDKPRQVRFRKQISSVWYKQVKPYLKKIIFST